MGELFFVHGRISVFVERPRHVFFSSWALREVWLCKKRAMVTSLLKVMLLEVGAGVLGLAPILFRWLMNSSVVCCCASLAQTPRPIHCV